MKNSKLSERSSGIDSSYENNVYAENMRVKKSIFRKWRVVGVAITLGDLGKLR
jgi:hypothetical protein